jgi:hypothetical protein
MPMKHRILVCAIGVLLATGSLLADTRFDFKTTEGTGGDLTSLTIAQGKIRTDAGKNTSVILDPGAGVMTIIDHNKKTFTKINKADLDAFAKQLADMMAGLPPEMQKMMAGRLGGGGGNAIVDFQPTGATSSVGGKPCKVYQMTMSGKVHSESCLADAAALDVPAADRATMQAAMAWSKELTDSLSKGPLGRFGDSVPFRNGGFPVRSTTFNSDGSRNTSELAGVSTAAVSADTFAMPAGYKEQKLDLPKIGRGGGAGK